jgi:TonB family protein
MIRQWVASAALALCTLTAGAAMAYPKLALEQDEVKQAKTEELKTDEASAGDVKTGDVKVGELSRKAKVKVAPVYPEMARRMSIAGTVKLAVVVAPNGMVKSSKPVGGHPLLVNAAMDAMKQWRFESAPTESSGIVQFTFQPKDPKD